MPAKQTRRSISVRAITHQRIKDYVDPQKKSVASFIEAVIAEHLGEPTDEDRRKFGELVKQREKESEAAQAVQKDSDELQEAKPLPDPPPPPPPPDEPGEGPVEAAPVAEPEPEQDLINKAVEALNIPQDAFQPAGPGGPEPVSEPELPREAAPAPPEPEREQPIRIRLSNTPRKLSGGSPAPNLKPPEDQPEDQPEGFEGYVPPILQF